MESVHKGCGKNSVNGKFQMFTSTSKRRLVVSLGADLCPDVVFLTKILFLMLGNRINYWTLERLVLLHLLVRCN